MTETQAEVAPIINVVGDSHTAYFNLPDQLTARRCGLPWPLPYKVRARVIPSASLVGLRGEEGTLRTRDIIRPIAAGASHLLLAFGQVDLEIGYYNRLVIKGEKMSPSGLVDYLMAMMHKFFSEVDLSKPQCAIKGVNLTAYNDRAFAARYIGKILSDRHAPDALDDVVRRTKKFFLGEAAQDELHMEFNARAKAFADERGYGYVDVNDFLARRDDSGQVAQPVAIDIAYLPIRRDHHVIHSLEMYREHYWAAGRAFGLGR
ncbi:hypothetical protein [Paracoccus sp. (in: a-proteobacteria)]|uniref:hypothetical protein n=1 Tax=Paracoccus sp. TaxID=267 RepID=UPI00289D870D|nr:hypothetical protein [Paracoccus sp. (in: a-proteobacteria)]